MTFKLSKRTRSQPWGGHSRQGKHLEDPKVGKHLSCLRTISKLVRQEQSEQE